MCVVTFSVLWHVSVASVRSNDLNHLSCVVEYWRRWPECVSAVTLRVVAECFVCNVMVVVDGGEKNVESPWISKCEHKDCVLYLLQGKMRRNWDYKLLISCLVLPYLPCEIWNNPLYNTGLMFIYCSSSKPIKISRLVTKGERRRENK